MTGSMSRPSRRTVLKLTGAAALAYPLAACASGGSTNQSDGGAKVVDYWKSFNSKNEEKWFRENWVDAFNATKPEATVDLIVKQTDTISQQIKTALASGTGPDVVLTGGPSLVGPYVKAGYLAPLDEYAEEYDWESRFMPWALATGKVDGKLYSVPTGYETLNVLYNVTTFDKLGWDLPTTRDEFEAMATEAAGRGIMPIANGNADFQGVSDWFGSILLNHSAGPDALAQALTGEIPFTDPVFVDAATQFNDYFQKGWVGGSVDRYFTNTFADMYSAVATGEALFHYTGSWVFVDAPDYFGEEAGNDGVWDWGAYPSFRDGVPEEVWELSIGGTQSLNADAHSLDGAAAFMDYVNDDPKKQGEMLAATGASPAAIKMTTADFPSDMDDRVKRLYQTMADAETVGYTTWTFMPGEADLFVSEGWDKVIAGKMTPAEWCSQLDEIFTKEVSNGFVAPISTT